jgi:hypothetical protein
MSPGSQAAPVAVSMALAKYLNASESGGDTGPAPGLPNGQGATLARMRVVYARTAEWLGEEPFDTTATRFLDVWPGPAEVAGAVDAFVAWAERCWPADIEVAELAWIDGYLHLASLADDCQAMPVAGLRADQWDTVEVEFVPSLRYRPMRSNAVALWRALAEGAVPPPVHLVPGNIGARVWRQERRTQVASMTNDESTCLDLALQGASFGEIRAFLDLTHDEEQTARIAGGCLGAWTAEGMVAALRR